MSLITKNEIKRQIGMLRYQKGMNQMKSEKHSRGCTTLFSDSMVDIMLNPLYYAWTELKYGSLDDVGCGSHVEESYFLFVSNAEAMLQELLVMLERVREHEHVHQNLVMIDSLLITYKKIQKIV